MSAFLNYDLAEDDSRKRSYVPPRRVLKSSPEVTGADVLVDRVNVQSYCHFDPPVCIIGQNGEIVLDFGVELHGQLCLVAGRMKGINHVRITLGESVSECLGTPTSDHAVHQATVEIPMLGRILFTESAFRFVRIQCPADNPSPLELIGACVQTIYHDWKYLGYFNSSDQRLNKIWDTSCYTVHINCQDYIYDGVKRDRLVWMGDLYPEVRTILSVFDEEKLIEKSLDFVQQHTGDDQWMNSISSYSCWYVITLRDLFLYRGNYAYLKSCKKPLKHLLKRLLKLIGSDGIEKFPPHRFLDWSTADNPAATAAGLQGLLSWTLNCGVDLANALGETKLANQCFQGCLKLQQAVAPDCHGNKIAGAMQILGDVGDLKRIDRDIMRVDPCAGISTFYGYFVLLAKAKAGDLTGAVELIRRYWGAMLDFGATTFWEDFDLDWTRNAYGIDQLPQPGKKDIHGDFGKHCYVGLRHSLCHGWAGGPAAFLSEHVLGIKPLEPGFSAVAVNPNLAGIESVEGAIPTPQGLIEVKVSAKGTKIKLPKGVKLVK